MKIDSQDCKAACNGFCLAEMAVKDQAVVKPLTNRKWWKGELV